MAAVGGAVQQDNRNTGEPVGAGLEQLGPQRRIQLKGLQLLTGGRQAPTHLNHQALQRLRPKDLQGEQVGAVLITDLEEIGEAAVHQQQGGRSLVLQKRIGGHRGAQAHLLHQGRRNRRMAGEIARQRQAQQAANGPDGGIPDDIRLLRQHLLHQQLTAGAAGHHIGEGAAAIDPEPPAGGHQR